MEDIALILAIFCEFLRKLGGSENEVKKYFKEQEISEDVTGQYEKCINLKIVSDPIFTCLHLFAR